MSRNRISRNDPCPCGSGKKFKNCCINKGIDWHARQSPGPRKLLPAITPRPRAPSPVGFAALGPFRVVDSRLKEIATAAPGDAAWKTLVVALSDATPEGERFAAYRTVREAGVLPEDTALFLFGHAIQWMPSGDEEDLDRHTVATLRRLGLDDLADLYAQDRLEYDRRYERGRQFFFGPPDEELAARLREKGIID
jgi:hypothetical protein